MPGIGNQLSLGSGKAASMRGKELIEAHVVLQHKCSWPEQDEQMIRRSASVAIWVETPIFGQSAAPKRNIVIETSEHIPRTPRSARSVSPCLRRQ